MMHSTFWAPADPVPAAYTIEARIEPEAGTVSGREVIKLCNTSDAPLGVLALSVPEGLCELRVAISGEDLPVASWCARERGEPVVFQLPTTLSPGDSIAISVAFRLSGLGLKDGNMIMDGWHPKLWWGYAVHDSFEVRVEAPSDWDVVASGYQEEAARAAYRSSGVRSFGLVLSRARREDTWAGDTVVRCLLASAGPRSARKVLAMAAEIVDYYRSELGFYPYPFLSVIQGHDGSVGGWPVATGIVGLYGLGRADALPPAHWRRAIAHEIAHQYWGECVLEGDTPGWLWLALGIWLDGEYARARGLGMGFHRHYLDSYMRAVARGVDTTVARPPEEAEQANLAYDYEYIVLHAKGFAILSALESVIGRSTFRRIIEVCLGRYRGRRKLGASEFQEVCERESGQELDWLFSQWVRSNRYLAYTASWEGRQQPSGGHRTVVTVQRVGTLSMPIPFEARFQDGSSLRGCSDRMLATTRTTFDSSAPLREVVLDPDAVLPLLSSPVPEIARRIAALPWAASPVDAVALFHAACKSRMTDGYLWFRLGLALYEAGACNEALSSFRHAEVGHAEWEFAGLVWQGHLLDLLGRRDEALARYHRARGQCLCPVHHEQYGIVLDADWVETRIRAPFAGPRVACALGPGARQRPAGGNPGRGNAACP
jgi:hypothetical protein